MNSISSNSTQGSKTNRRSFLRTALGVGAGAAALPAAMTLAPRSAKADDAASLAQDLKVLTLALNLEYLEAEYYTYAEFGDGIENHGVGIDGSTAPGVTTVKANAKVEFESSIIAGYASEIAADERNHVNFLRSVFVAAGAPVPAKPNIDLLNSFNEAAVAAGIGSSFDPFENDLNFALGSFIFEDVGVTAYHGGAPLITNASFLSAAAGILAVEAIHAALIRTIIFLEGSEAQAIAAKISDLRDSVDGVSDKDQTLADPLNRPDFAVNIVPTDSNALVYQRSEKKVLNIVYGGRQRGGGLFFPNGINM